jgi:hypothetical protein
MRSIFVILLIVFLFFLAQEFGLFGTAEPPVTRAVALRRIEGSLKADMRQYARASDHGFDKIDDYRIGEDTRGFVVEVDWRGSLDSSGPGAMFVTHWCTQLRYDQNGKFVRAMNAPVRR